MKERVFPFSFDYCPLLFPYFVLSDYCSMLRVLAYVVGMLLKLLLIKKMRGGEKEIKREPIKANKCMGKR